MILDRQVDLATPLHHTWTYQALAHDVLQYSLNRVSITEGDQGKILKVHFCDFGDFEGCPNATYLPLQASILCGVMSRLSHFDRESNDKFIVEF